MMIVLCPKEPEIQRFSHDTYSIGKKKIFSPVCSIFLFLLLVNTLFAQELSFEIDETGLAFFDAALDVDLSGQFIAVWQDFRHCPEYGKDNEGGAAIYIQKFDAHGVMSGHNIRIDEKNDDDISNTNPDIAINKATGDIVIVWQERSGASESGSKTKSRIIASIFSASFEKIAFQFVVNPSDTLWQAFPEVKYLSNNNILIIWHINRYDGQFYQAKLYNSLGAVVKETFLTNANDLPSSTTFFDALPSGGFYFVWDSYMQFYDNWGTPVTDVLEGSFENVNAVKSLNEEGILIITRDECLSRLEGVVYHLVENSYGERFRIDDDTTTVNTRGGSDIAVNQSGDFIVVWTDGRHDYNNWYDVSDIYAQRFDKNVTPIGNNFKVNHEESEIKQYFPKVSLYQNRFITIFSQGAASEPITDLPLDDLPFDVINVSAGRSYLIGASQDFTNPTPGQVYGWESLFLPPPEVMDVSRPAYPNPFVKRDHDFVTVEFDLDKEVTASCMIYNVFGQQIKTLFSSCSLPADFYRVKWYGGMHNGGMATSGLYLCVLRIDEEIYTKKIVFIRD